MYSRFKITRSDNQMQGQNNHPVNKRQKQWIMENPTRCTTKIIANT